jgi:formamidopyrimidine-DNA glycosylase
MPELPEVESARFEAAQWLQGRRVAAATAAEDGIVFVGSTGPAVAAQLVGRTVVGTGRKGKYFWLELDTRPWLLLHFGMTGQTHLTGVAAPQYRVAQGETRAPDAWPPRFLKLELVMDNGQRWAFTDPRRLGRIRLVDDPPAEPPVALLGFDPYLAMPALPAFQGWLAGRTAPIKAVLLDQSVAAGVGNWIADEVLYQARVHPDVSTAHLAEDEVAAIHTALERIVRVAVACKTAGRDNPPDWLFHYRWAKGRGGVARDHHGNAISFATVGGRTSAIVLALQKMRRRPASAAAAVAPPADARAAAVADATPAKRAGRVARKGVLVAASAASAAAAAVKAAGKRAGRPAPAAAAAAVAIATAVAGKRAGRPAPAAAAAAVAIATAVAGKRAGRPAAVTVATRRSTRRAGGV